MKKNNLWKAIGICFIAYIILSWLIPVGTISSGVLSKGDTVPLGFFDILRYPIITASTTVFVVNAIVILLIGGFYGVLNQTGVYSRVVQNLAGRFHQNSFLIISILVLSILSSLTGLTLPLFTLVPFLVAVILTLGCSKVVALLSTVGAILVGNMGSTYGFNINGYLSFFFETKMNDTIITRLLFFIAVVGLFIGIVLYMNGKKSTKESEIKDLEIPLYKNHDDKKKSAVPMVVVSIVSIVVILIGMYNWADGLGISFFKNIYDSIMEVEISGYPLFKNILGSIDMMGSWSNYEFAIILLLSTLLIAWIYNIKGKEKWDSFISGLKEMVPVALYVVAASIIFLLMNVGNATFFNTIANFFLTIVKGFNVFTFGLLSMVGSLFYQEFPYLVNSLYDPITTLYTNYGFIGMMLQMFHGFVMLVAPTSIILVAGLSFLNISYTEWLKNIWKYMLFAFLIIAAFTAGLLLLG